MRPLLDNQTSTAQVPSQQPPTMRLRDPISSYKCFEAIATPSPIAEQKAIDISSLRHSSSSIAAAHNMNRATSLDSLANSSEADEGTSSSSDERDDCNDISDVDSISDFGTATGNQSVVSAQVHRRSDLEELNNAEHGIREPVVIKAYLEKSHRKCDYKNCGYKKGGSTGGVVIAEVPIGRVEKEVQMREKEIRQQHNDSDSDEIDESMMTPAVAATMSGIVASSAGSLSTQVFSSTLATISLVSTNNSSSSKTRRLSVASSGSVGRMETILEEPIESKISVKEILARFETLNSLEV